MTLQVPHTRRQRNFPAPASRETLQELPNRRPPAPPSGASALQWERVSPDRYEIRLGASTLGFIDVVGAVFVVLHGATYSRAVECAQTLVFDDALYALTSGGDAMTADGKARRAPEDVPAEGAGQSKEGKKMSNNPILPVIPGADETARATAAGEPPTTEIDGDRKLDPDANDDLIDSADADRVATEAHESTSS